MIYHSFPRLIINFWLLYRDLFLSRQIDRNGNLWVLSDRLPVFMYSQLDLHDYNFRILTGSAEELIMGTVCGSTSPSFYPTTTMYDHRDHMDHMDHINHIDHKDHVAPRIRNSAGFVKIEIVTMMLICLSKALVWRVTMKKFGNDNKKIIELKIR